MDIEAAKNKCRIAGVAALVQGVITLAVVCYAIFGNSGNEDAIIDFFDDPFFFVDVVIIFLLATGLFLKSRTAAILLLVYFVASTVIFISETGKASGIGLSLVFIYLYYQGIAGAFVYTRLRREKDNDYRKKPLWLVILASVALLLFSGLLSLGLYASVTKAPSTAVEKGEDLPESYLIWLRENGVIEANEKIDLFYSEGFLSIEDGGNILTDARVISYYKADEALEIDCAVYGEVTAIILEQKGNFLSDTSVKIIYGTEEDPGWFYLLLSAEENGDQVFIDLLEQRTGFAIKSELDSP